MAAGIYVHIPFCTGKCFYCAFVSSVSTDAERVAYVGHLTDEIQKRAEPCRAADTVYFGGGTPALLKASQVGAILAELRKGFFVSRDAEITLETNPDLVTKERLEKWTGMGINRLSIGVQSTEDRLLKLVGRRHTAADFFRAADVLNGAGFQNFNVDLMVGLPTQTKREVETSVLAAVDAGASHLSVYSLIPEEGTHFADYRPDEDASADFYDLACGIAETNGLHRYEVSNFAKRGAECRHNLKYWTGGDYLGFGAAAHSLSDGVRSANSDRVPEYMQGIGGSCERLTIEDRREEFLMLGLRLRDGISKEEYRRRFGRDLSLEKRKQLDGLVSLGAVIETEDTIRVAPGSFYVLDSIILQLI